VKDDATDPTRTVANVRGLAAEGVVAVVGGCGTGSAVAAAPVLNQLKVPFIGPVAAADVLYEPVLPYVFSIYPAYNLQLSALTAEAIASGDIKSVALVATERPGWEKVEADVEAAATDGGATFLGAESSALGTTDFTADAVKIASEKPDLLVSHLGVAEASRMLIALDAQGFMPKAVVVDSAQASEAFVEPGGYLAAGRLGMVSTVPLPDADAASECVDALNAAGVDVTSFALQGCSQAQVFAAGVKAAGDEVTRETLREALETLDNVDDTILPPWGFSAEDHLALDSMYVFGVDGKEMVDTGETVDLAR
jgi:branched-chain amino acid transport system substrate-binding protein